MTDQRRFYEIMHAQPLNGEPKGDTKWQCNVYDFKGYSELYNTLYGKKLSWERGFIIGEVKAGKSLEELAGNLVKNKFLMNKDNEDKITTIPSPAIIQGRILTQLTEKELLEFYIAFKVKSFPKD